jgi:hypothetical protein
MISAVIRTPAHQFGFRKRHTTIEQTHRVVQRIHKALENKQYCSAAFLDMSQAFEKVWHTGLLYKLRQTLPLNYFFLKSYLHFLVKVETEYSDLTTINAGVPQGNVLCPLLYLLYTADLPEYLHRCPASRKRRHKGNTVPGGITGPPCSWEI